MFLKINDAIKESLSFIKIKYISLTHFQDEPISGIPQFHAITLPSFPQYTLNTPNDTNDTRNFVDEHVLMSTLHWTAYYNVTNPLCLPLTNTHDSIEKNKEMLYRLTTTLTPRQFTYVG